MDMPRTRQPVIALEDLPPWQDLHCKELLQNGRDPHIQQVPVAGISWSFRCIRQPTEHCDEHPDEYPDEYPDGRHPEEYLDELTDEHPI